MHLCNKLLLQFLNDARLGTRKFKFNFSAKIMDDNELLTLKQRLERAEETLRLINQEIREIKAKIHFIQTNGAPITSVRQFSTSASKRCLNGEELMSICTDVKKTKYDFEVVDDHVVVYTDGACTSNGSANAKAGIGVWFGPNHPLNVSKAVNGKATNNVAEIQACITAVQLALDNNISKLCIKTDSQFVINSITKWIKKWKKNNWKVVNGNDVKNKEDFMKLDKLCEKLTVKWEYVPGHSNYLGNEAADALAQAGASKYLNTAK